LDNDYLAATTVAVGEGSVAAEGESKGELAVQGLDVAVVIVLGALARAHAGCCVDALHLFDDVVTALLARHWGRHNLVEEVLVCRVLYDVSASIDSCQCARAHRPILEEWALEAVAVSHAKGARAL
jgi:hypothetical protein